MYLTSSFDKQWRVSGTCALHALRHALIVMGVPTTSEEVEAAMGAGLWRRFAGNSEHAIYRALPHFGLRHDIVDTPNETLFRLSLDAALAAGSAVLLCIDDESHWITVTGKRGGRFLWIDSNAEALFGDSSLAELAPRAQYEASKRQKHFWALIPRPASSQLLRPMVPRMEDARWLLAADPIARQRWGHYLSVALELDQLASGSSGRRLWRYLDGPAHALWRALRRAGIDAREAAAEIRRLSRVSYCHDTRMPAADRAADLVAGVLQD